LQRATSPDAHSWPTGVSAGVGADDQRLRGVAERFVARFSADRDGAHEADADLRDQSGQLGGPRRAVCGLVPGNVAAGIRDGAATRTALESADAMTAPTPILRLDDVHLRRGAREILRGVSLNIVRGELVAV